MKKLPNLSEEIAAMAKIDSAGASSTANANPSNTDRECEKFNSSAKSDEAPKAKKKCRDKLVHEFRISVSLLPIGLKRVCNNYTRISSYSHCPRK